MDRPLATARGRKPQHQKKQRQKLKSAASAANRLVTKPQSRKDRKTALAAAARLFELAERNGTKIECVGAEESDGEDIGMEEAMAERGFEIHVDATGRQIARRLSPTSDMYGFAAFAVSAASAAQDSVSLSPLPS